SRLPPAEAEPIAGVLAKRIATEKDAATTASLSWGLAELASQLKPAEAAKLVRQPVRAVVERLVKERDLNVGNSLGTGLSNLARQVSPVDVLPWGKILIDRITAEGEPWLVVNAATGLAALADRFEPEERMALLNPPARRLGQRLATERDFNILQPTL